MRRAFCLLSAIVSVLVASPAFAGPACYTSDQMKAEQLLRLHSELMVITVTCRQGSEGQALPPLYAGFTRKNLKRLNAAEKAMIAYYKGNDKGNPIDHLDRLRTKLGNEYGQKIAEVSAPQFCAQYRDKVAQFYGASPADLEDQARLMAVTEQSYVPACERAVVAKKGK